MHRLVGSCSLAFVSLVGLVSLPGGDALAAVGGPDGFGYTFADQDDGAVYGYVDIRATGTLLISADDATATTPLGAPFSVYGVVYNAMGVSTNGFLSDDVTLAADFSSDCPMPAPPSVGAGSFRLAALHDDLETAVYYQYFDQAAAAAVGYPGEAAGISVFQWYGEHWPGPADSVDAEMILFHDDNSILSMVALDNEGGMSSTTGIQNMDASIGLTYVCNSGGSVIPGVTAVEFTPGPTPDSDCCSLSPTGTPGCANAACQAIVCANDPLCCSTDWDAGCAAAANADCPLLCGGPPPVIAINEIRINQDGPDDEEYFELVADPGTSLNDLWYIVLGDAPTGEIEEVIDLTGGVVPASAFFVGAQASFTLSVPDLVTPLNFENGDTVTHMLVGGFTGALGQNLDPNGDGVLDSTPWLVLLDAVSVIEEAGDDLPYANPPNCVPNANCQQIGDPPGTPNHIFRCGNVSGGWNVGLNDVSATPFLDTPGDLNACDVCGNGILEFGEVCDDQGESPACDDDCTLPACGDGVPNMAAGEDCDDAGESPVCDPDCTVAECGDAFVNMSAGETCDDGGESATCDDDCTAPECGDGVTNMVAGETCDDAGESATCDVDCTVAECGDGLTNPTAGETCDEGGPTPTCNVNCTVPSCGDGFVDMLAGEECDGDGAGNPGPTEECDEDCTLPACGDGVLNALAGEICDEGGNTEACDEDCTEPECGDTLVNPAAGEDCDEAGETATCDINCTVAECGDGTLNFSAGEQCEDGNNEDGDGCSAECTIEDGPLDSSGGGSGVDDTAGATSLTTSPVTSGFSSSSGGETDTDTDTDTDSGGVVVPGDGCSCSTEGPLHPRWSWLALVGLGVLVRRRQAVTRG